MPLLFISLSFAADCAEPLSVERFNQLLTDAEASYARMDDNFPKTMQATVDAIACVEDIIPREMAARVHRAVGLQMFLSGEKSKAEQSFAAARAVETFYEFPEDLVPSSSPIRAAYTAISTDVIATALMPSPQSGNIRLDGDISLQRATGWPMLFQYIDSTGHVLSSDYLWQDEALPAYPQVAPAKSGGGGGSPLMLVAGSVSAGLLGAGVGMWVSNWPDFNSYCDPVEYSNDLEWCESAANRIWVGNALVGVGVAGLAATSVWVVLSPSGVGVGGTF